MTVAVHTKADLAKARAALPGRVAVVPTMGALHDGHRALIKRAKEVADSVVVTVFVNPLQFRPNEDLDTYPRTLEADLAMCGAEGVDLVFAPSVNEMYPDGRDGLTTVHAGPDGEILEGASRPGFFTGVLTVVSKLFHLTRPDAALFGEKDFQQLAMVRRMVRDLDMGIDVVAVATDREPDGLARSSRNVFLSEAERAAALAIPRAVEAAQASPDPLAAAQKTLSAEPGLDVDYVVVRATDLGEAPAQGPARLLIAAKAGTTRLIDNAPVVIGDAR
ncbi:pantoate--beta-alanine ligase [Glycomyces algeriensis]|uniref:Pantothenate synthetase n=1 Tax=Glycomyces algeriensis TaxID=256037 RepID=A0A9W6G4L3_9ACTN|nr:pantoate--beta-alanine ligase [Glycomyces algeriensis]MDA1368424.1 pantoate--beta-alanine ligase [Glycomyces algeriensis]MDR7353230.1 pantoate--beta-alanine ligase [Glycomyces algeriensis]GLI40924.1 pantothenate synthetase [Glycomyces algeriensis]